MSVTCNCCGKVYYATTCELCHKFVCEQCREEKTGLCITCAEEKEIAFRCEIYTKLQQEIEEENFLENADLFEEDNYEDIEVYLDDEGYAAEFEELDQSSDSDYNIDREIAKEEYIQERIAEDMANDSCKDNYNAADDLEIEEQMTKSSGNNQLSEKLSDSRVAPAFRYCPKCKSESITVNQSVGDTTKFKYECTICGSKWFTVTKNLG